MSISMSSIFSPFPSPVVSVFRAMAEDVANVVCAQNPWLNQAHKGQMLHALSVLGTRRGKWWGVGGGGDSAATQQREREREREREQRHKGFKMTPAFKDGTHRGWEATCYRSAHGKQRRRTATFCTAADQVMIVRRLRFWFLQGASCASRRDRQALPYHPALLPGLDALD